MFNKKFEISSSRGSDFIPQYADSFASGFDIKADLSNEKYKSDMDVNSCTILPGERILIPTGLKVDIPDNFEIQIRSRSGLSLNSGITVLNSPGTIDSNYTGYIGIILHNSDKKDFTVTDGMKIAQGVLCPVYRAIFTLTESIEKVTTRAEAGFGSTGL